MNSMLEEVKPQFSPEKASFTEFVPNVSLLFLCQQTHLISSSNSTDTEREDVVSSGGIRHTNFN